MIVLTYPCVGKTKVSSVSANYIDFDTTHFQLIENYEKQYANLLEHLSIQDYTVLGDAIPKVVELLSKSKESKLLVYPCADLDIEWKERSKRACSVNKDYRNISALDRMYAGFEEQINWLDMVEGFDKIKLTSNDYDLSKLIEDARMKDFEQCRICRENLFCMEQHKPKARRGTCNFALGDGSDYRSTKVFSNVEDTYSYLER